LYKDLDPKKSKEHFLQALDMAKTETEKKSIEMNLLLQ